VKKKGKSFVLTTKPGKREPKGTKKWKQKKTGNRREQNGASREQTFPRGYTTGGRENQRKDRATDNPKKEQKKKNTIFRPKEDGGDAPTEQLSEGAAFCGDEEERSSKKRPKKWGASQHRAKNVHFSRYTHEKHWGDKRSQEKGQRGKGVVTISAR